jgi:hypothetical protein
MPSRILLITSPTVSTCAKTMPRLAQIARSSSSAATPSMSLVAVPSMQPRLYRTAGWNSRPRWARRAVGSTPAGRQPSPRRMCEPAGSSRWTRGGPQFVVYRLR